jgi:hypothetical protein
LAEIKKINSIHRGNNMLFFILSSWITIFSFFLFLPQKGYPVDDEIQELKMVIEAFEKKYSQKGKLQLIQKTTDASGVKKDRNKKIRPVGVPIYKPPRRGAPVGRVAGGTRGIFDEYPSLLCVIAPDHTAMTLRDQPHLFWFLRDLTSYQIELTVIEDQAIYPVLEARIRSPERPGFQDIRLADYGIYLQQDIVYKWFVAIVPDQERRSKDILAWGAVRYIEISNELKRRLLKFDKLILASLYATAGIWYDAFSEISALIAISPNDLELRENRNTLLEQIGFSEIAKYDTKN